MRRQEMGRDGAVLLPLRAPAAHCTLHSQQRTTTHRRTLKTANTPHTQQIFVTSNGLNALATNEGAGMMTMTTLPLTGFAPNAPPV